MNHSWLAGLVAGLFAGGLAACSSSSSKSNPDGATGADSAAGADGATAGTGGTAGADASVAGSDGGAGTGGSAGTDGGAAGTGGSTGDAGSMTAAYTVALNPAAPTLAAGGTGTVQVNLGRGSFMDTITLSATGAPTGVILTFMPAMVTGDSTTLKIDVADTVAPNTYPIAIQAISGNSLASATLSLVVTAPATVMLVDDDYSDNNQMVMNPMASASDTLMAQALKDQNLTYNTTVVPNEMNGPTADDMKKYSTVVWYTGPAYGGTNNVATISATDEIQLAAWLDMGGKRLIILSDEYVYGLPNTDWAMTDAQNKLFASYVGGMGGKEAATLNHTTLTVTGAASSPAAGLSLTIGKDSPIDSFFNVVNPAAGTDTLFTVSYDPDDSGTARAVPVAIGRKNVGLAGTSKVVYVGFPLENIVVTDKTNDVQKKALAAIFAY